MKVRDNIIMGESADIKKMLRKADPDIQLYLKTIEKENLSLHRQLIQLQAHNKSLLNRIRAY
jgi:hypothetical protein